MNQAKRRSEKAKEDQRASKPKSGQHTETHRRLSKHKPFPVECLPEPLKSFVSSGAKALGCDAAYLVLPLLSALGSAIGNTRALRLKKGWCAPPIIWTLIVGESGSLKTPAMKLVLRAVHKRQAKAMKDHEQARQQYEIEMAEHRKRLTEWKANKDTSKPPPREPRQPRLQRSHTVDATLEAIASLLKDNPRGLLVTRDEISGWFGSFDRYASGKGGGDEGHWLSMFNGQSLIVDRKTGTERTIYVPAAFVSITGGIQPGILKRVMTTERRESGMAARFLTAYPSQKSKVWTEAEIDEQAEEEVVRVFARLFEMEAKGTSDDPVPVELSLSPKARALWIAYYNENAAEQAALSGDLHAAWAKLEEYPARLALVINLVRWAADDPTLVDGSQVDERSMAAAIRLCKWFKQEARRIHALLTEDDATESTRQLLGWIERQENRRVTARDVQRNCTWFRSQDLADAALQTLVNEGFGHWENSPPGQVGAPTRYFVLNPEDDVDETPSAQADSQGSVDKAREECQRRSNSSEESVAI